MIVFDLRCGSGHVFEAWFGSSSAFADQQERGLLACPLCGDTQVTKAVMAPNVGAKGNRSIGPASSVSASPPPASPAAITEASAVPAPGNLPAPPEMKAALQQLARAQATLLASSKWVGRGFAEQARAMHDGTVAQVPIHGQATVAEARALLDEGVPVAPLPFPVTPPESLN